jgi:DNA-binding NtrC family response regulator
MNCDTRKGKTSVRKRMRTKATVLVIEDERVVRDATCEILRGGGYRVVQAESAAAAQTVFLRYGKIIHLLLCDAVLPDSSGARLSRELRERSPELKVILASGYPRAGLAEAGDTESTSDFLAKPYGAASLLSKVETVLQGKIQLTFGDGNGAPGECAGERR